MNEMLNNKFKKDLIILICVFCISWVIGDACKNTYDENMRTAIINVFLFFIVLGMHTDIKNYIKTKINKIRKVYG